ncbi:hypothetical protein PR001_g33216, partial [Phytophthora rubi]
MLAVLRSLCRPPPCSSCCSRCHRYRYARREAVAGLTGMLPDDRPCRRHAHHLAMLLSLCRPPQCPLCRCRTMAAAAMLVVLRSLCRSPPCSSCCSRCHRYRYA